MKGPGPHGGAVDNQMAIRFEKKTLLFLSSLLCVFAAALLQVFKKCNPVGNAGTPSEDQNIHKGLQMNSMESFLQNRQIK